MIGCTAMDNINFELIVEENIEQCRDLCNELMAFQKSKAIMFPEAFNSMNFETRLLQSFKNSPINQIIVAKDGENPVGYVFSTVEDVKKGDKSSFPAWMPDIDTDAKGFYPDWEYFPDKIGCLNHLYVKKEYRRLSLGAKLLDKALAWLESFEDVDITFVYISNGNTAAFDFYLQKGFTYSHEVFGGFIKAFYRPHTN